MEYRSQRIAYWYFAVALLLFSLQVVLGLWLAYNYSFTVPQQIVDIFPFATARAMHTNLLVLWMLLGFMGGTYYIVPEETKSEIYSEKLAWFQLAALVATGVTALVGFFFGWTQGRPLLEIPTSLDLVVVVGALVFLFNVGMTMFLAKRWTAIQGTLLGGLVFLALLYLFGIPFYDNEVIDWYYWWWVIHLWVEGAWELVTAAIFAFVLMKLTGVDRHVVEKWLYVEVGLFLFTGIAGTGHHYYWIGAPKYWLWIGGVFSALEPLPILLMLIDTMMHVKDTEGEDQKSTDLDHCDRLRRHALYRRRHMGLHAYPAADQLLHARVAGNGFPRPSRFLRRLRAPEHHGLLFCHAETEGDRCIRSEARNDRLLDHDLIHDAHGHLPGRGGCCAVIPRTGARHGIHGGPIVHAALDGRDLLSRDLFFHRRSHHGSGPLDAAASAKDCLNPGKTSCPCPVGRGFLL